MKCVIDSFTDGVATGWAHDPRFINQPARFYVVVDGEQSNEVICDGIRPDVVAIGLSTTVVGYSFRLPHRFLDGAPHQINFRDVRRQPVTLTVNGNLTDAVQFAATWQPTIRSHVDGLRGSGLEGWVLRSNFETNELEGDCVVRVTCEGTTIGHTRANRIRADVGKALNASVECGFRFKLPPSIRRGCKQEFRFFLMPGDHELDASPLTLSLVTDDTEAKLLDLSDAINHMHVEITRLRRQVREILPDPDLDLADYDDWYPAYADALHARVMATRSPTRPTPLISVVCPIYKPQLNEFCAAVKSIIAQTYEKWELILVDDGSDEAELTDCINAFTKTDARIKSIALSKNAGISHSTNAGLNAAVGEWVAFFDHDDLLADTALEVMVRAAQASGAKVLYSDEDKIDEAGHYSQPAFKPDWNYRLALGVNYVCHLLFVSVDALKATGPLNSKYNGAQDHDLILRLSEHVAPHAIVHVPEILYHWRITARSTASTIDAKPYAIAAGLTCVQDHLRRLGRPAKVSSFGERTLYHQEWSLTKEPEVEIIIPFKDEIATTRRCVETLLSKTLYGNFRIKLVDNWSTSDAAKGFCNEFAKHRLVSVLRIEEPFNYSRLNNLAVKTSTAEYLVFMNNDVFVTNPGWLRACVTEATVDPAVAIVGGKFLYPSRKVQHAGIILGLGGVAGHIGVGLPDNDYGYGGRLLFAQEYSGVTAAGMLVRRSVFDEVGGLNERDLTIAFNDVDFCMKARAAGYKVIWTPDFLAEHHESLSRGDDLRPAQEARFFHESEHMKERWGSRLVTDPFYNKNLSLDRSPYTVLLPANEAASRDWMEIGPTRPQLAGTSWRLTPSPAKEGLHPQPERDRTERTRRGGAARRDKSQLDA